MKKAAAVVGLFVGAGIYYYAIGDGLIAAMVAGGVSASGAIFLNALVSLAFLVVFVYGFYKLVALTTDKPAPNPMPSGVTGHEYTQRLSPVVNVEGQRGNLSPTENPPDLIPNQRRFPGTAYKLN